MFIFAKELLGIVVCHNGCKTETTKPTFGFLDQPEQNKREGRSKLIGKNRQYVIAFTWTDTTRWNIRLNQLSRREVSVDDAVACTGLNS